MSTRPPLRPRAAYPHQATIHTRWADNDIFGHVNNVVYYSYFDTVVNNVLLDGGVLDPLAGDVVGLVVASGCDYAAPVAHPAVLCIGLGVTRLGRSSVTYALGVFDGAAQTAAAQGQFTHVYVDRITRRPVALPDAFRALLTPLVIAD